jgi:sugar phosphate isomerase/epimerase
MNPRLLLALLLPGSLLAAEPTTPNPGLHYYYEVPPANPAQTIRVDVCVYGGTPGGVGAAVQARRMGKTAALAVFRRHVGGLTAAGLTAVDTGKAASIGGMAMDFLKRAAGDKVLKADGSPDLNFRPSEAEKTFRAMLEEAQVPVYFEHRLKSVMKDGNRITALTFENGNTIEAKMFIDATYEGDLFARAGVKYFVGREDNSVYGETVNGFQIAKTHQFRFEIDPWRKAGYPDSGLLPGISPEPPRAAGTGDKLVQAYNFRMWAASSGDFRSWPKPAGYNRDDYALLERYLKSAPPDFVWDFTYRHGPVKLNRGDCNNAGPISTDLVGGSNEWPEADYATRERIFQQHVTYQQGMMWYLANDHAVPPKVVAFTQTLGLPLDEFIETGGWPHDLYVREGRRMISDYVMTEHDCTGAVVAEDPVGLASYTMDSHHTSRVLIDGKPQAEGCIEKKTPQPYPISYRAIVPREAECANLLVPVCLSSTHVAYGSIRMEPVFMLLGQSAATAAAQAIDAGVSVQKIDYARLRERLLADRQELEWKQPTPSNAGSPAETQRIGGLVVAGHAWTWGKGTVFEAIDHCKEAGVSALEVFLMGQTLSTETGEVLLGEVLPDDALAKLQAKCAASGVRIVNAYIGQKQWTRIGQDEAALRKFFEFGKKLGLSGFTGEPAEAQWDMVEKLVKEFDVTFSIHNHARGFEAEYFGGPYPYWDPRQTAQKLNAQKRDPRFGICLDTGHAARSGLNNLEVLKAIAGRCISVHLKDISAATLDAHDVPYGAGIVDVAGLLAELKRQNIRGHVGLEYEWTESPTFATDVKDFVAFIRNPPSKNP